MYFHLDNAFCFNLKKKEGKQIINLFLFAFTLICIHFGYDKHVASTLV